MGENIFFWNADIVAEVREYVADDQNNGGWVEHHQPENWQNIHEDLGKKNTFVLQARRQAVSKAFYDEVLRRLLNWISRNATEKLQRFSKYYLQIALSRNPFNCPENLQPNGVTISQIRKQIINAKLRHRWVIIRHKRVIPKMNSLASGTLLFILT